ncbi:MAG TPA: hypothetical protein V6C90_20640 [Coleofasciculaceae cyanobacterium]
MQDANDNDLTTLLTKVSKKLPADDRLVIVVDALDEIAPNWLQTVSASEDNTLKLWDLKSGEMVASFSRDGQLVCCAVAPDGVTIVAGERSGRVHFLRLKGCWNCLSQ